MLSNRLYMRNNNSCIAYSKTDRDLRLAFLNLRILEDKTPSPMSPLSATWAKLNA
jgi:hypothetical protein